MDSIHDDDYKVLVNELKEAREESGLTQKELGDRLGRDQTFVSKYETRERRLDIIELRDVCRAIGLPVTSLLDLLDNHELASDEQVEEAASTVTDLFASYPELDSKWNSTDWEQLIRWFVDNGILTYKEIGALMLGHLNPSQVGTSIASKKTFQKHYPKGKTWQSVRKWHFDQLGRCHDCGTRLELQADHIETREDHGDAADRLENMTLRCRRCNVIRRPSHKNGGQTFLTAEAALMWILFTKRPTTYQAYEKLCREYGLTMANIRFQESWAMARWLSRDGLYTIDEGSSF